MRFAAAPTLPLRPSARLLALGIALGALGACTRNVTNPSFAVTIDEAADELRWRESHRVHLCRPVVMLAGYMDPGTGVARAAAMLRRAVGPDDWVIEVPFFSVTTWESCRARVIEKVIERFGADADGSTVEVDVIAFSMGGLVARYAAMDRPGEPRLRIAHLYTIATPHRGAPAAEVLTPDERVQDMRPGSPLLTELDAAFGSCGYEVVSYVRLDDGIVGVEAARGPDGRLWWVPNKPMSLAHLRAFFDERIVADIVRRLANEDPWTTEPCAPWPGAREEKPL